MSRASLSKESSLKELPGAAKSLKTSGSKQAQKPVPHNRKARTPGQHPRQKAGKRKFGEFLLLVPLIPVEKLTSIA